MELKNFLLDLFFPKFCFGCKKEGIFLCQDCLSTIDIFKKHKKFKNQFLDDLFIATPYKNFIVKKLILAFKYEPFVKEIAKDLAQIIKIHFQLLDKKPNFSDFVLIPVPLSEERLKWRGFNQAEEVAKEISKFFKIPLIRNSVMRLRETLPQVELSEEERKRNLKGVFFVKNRGEIEDKKILVLDDVFTTGSTLTELAKVLKENGAKKVIGIVVAVANVGEDKP
jgi:ComF family protein